MKQLKVLVSGGGIAGNSLAFWLSKLGHQVTVVEWFPTLRASGLQVDLRGPGIQILKKMGLEEAFRAKSIDEQGMRVVDSAGKSLAYFPTNRSNKGVQNFSSDFEILRGDLCRLLYDACKDRVEFMFGTQIQTLENKEDAVDVTLSNGTKRVFDLVIAADGVGSKTRKKVYQEDGFKPLGSSRMAYFTTNEPVDAGELYTATWYLAPEGRFVMTRRHAPNDTQIYFFCHNDSPILDNSSRNVEAQKKLFADTFRGAGWNVDGFIEAMIKSKDFYCEHLGLVKLDSWIRGRVVMLGDSAWCPTANTGMGTTSAITGSYVLAGEISKCFSPSSTEASSGLEAALKKFEDVYRPFMDKVQKGVEKEGDWMPKGRLGIFAMHTMLRVVSLIRINWIGEYVLKESAIKNWELPEYPVLDSCVSSKD